MSYTHTGELGRSPIRRPRNAAVSATLGLLGVAAAVVLASLAVRPAAPGPVGARTGADAREAFAALPLHFEPNLGQTDARVAFLSRGRDYALLMTQRGAVLKLARAGGPEAVMGVGFVGANPRPKISAGGRLAGVSHYVARGGVRNVPQYGRVTYRDVYDGVDVIFYGSRGGELEFDVKLAPGVDPGRVRLDYSGARDLRVDAEGALVLNAGGVQVRQPRPVVYQEIGGVRRSLAGRYVLHGGDRVGFAVDGRDPRAAVVIDPVLTYSTYLGGSGLDFPIWSDIDADGNFYVTGFTLSADFPTTEGTYQRTAGGAEDAFVAKLDPSGSRLVYSTYVGRAASDVAIGLDVDRSGAVVITGTTGSADFPTTEGAYQRVYGGGASDAFVTKLDPSGARIVFSTFLGGSGEDAGFISFFDAAQNLFIEGDTGSADFPTTPGVLQPNYGGARDGFVAQLNRLGSELRYSTFIGGSGPDGAHDGWLDASGSFYIDGLTESQDFPTTPGAVQPTYGGERDAFVAKVNPSATALDFSTYVGGSGFEDVFDLTIDRQGNVYVPGPTTSRDFPTTPHAFQSTYQGGDGDGYVIKLDRTGAALDYATYLGGSGNEQAGAIRVDRSGNAFVAGVTASADFPVTEGAIQGSYGGGVSDAFLVELSRRGSKLRFASFLGGSGEDGTYGAGGWLDRDGNWFVPGYSDSSDFPTTPGAFQPANAGGVDVFLVKVDLHGKRHPGTVEP
jgi:hypothetical protein